MSTIDKWERDTGSDISPITRSPGNPHWEARRKKLYVFKHGYFI